MDTHQHTEEFKKRCNAVYEQIRDAAQKVINTLGVGFLEKVYENALAVELRKRGLKVEQQKVFRVYYEEVLVGEYVTDLFVDDCVITELKMAKVLDDIHLAICINYLRVTKMWLCVLINFGKPSLDLKRVVLG